MWREASAPVVEVAVAVDQPVMVGYAPKLVDIGLDKGSHFGPLGFWGAGVAGVGDEVQHRSRGRKAGGSGPARD